LHKRAEIRNCLLIAAGLAVLTLAAFWPVTRADFVNIDDPTYVVKNIRVQQGLTGENLHWAFTTFHFSNWHPLTWLSYMLDIELFGLNPRAMHVVNLGWHLASTLLLFGLLQRMTRAMWPAALVAALFAVHPLHVESVAWISERKDVLSTFFWIASLWAYSEYAKVRCPGWYCGALVLCILGLMCKAMLVTLPFAFLLLDVWPLKRFEMGAPGSVRNLVRLATEKIPFFAVAGVVAYVAFLAQRAGESVVAFAPLSLSQRMENALVSYARYLAKTFWPVDLAVFYPHPGDWPALQVVLSFVLIVGLSALALGFVRRYPFLFTGWFWFVGTFLPVIGLVQVGGQSMADRYTYVPSIGLFIALVWAAKEGLARLPRMVMMAVPATIVLLCAIATHRQAGYWRDSLSLFTHASKVTPPNGTTLNNLGSALLERGRQAEATEQFRKALELDPEDVWALGNVGNALLREGKTDEALAHYRKGLREKPNTPQLQFNLGVALAAKGEFTNAIAHYERALELDPFHLDAQLNLGNAWMALGRAEAAATNYSRVLQLMPGHAPAHYNRGNAALAQRQIADAIRHFSEAIRLDPQLADAHRRLAVALEESGRVDEARKQLEHAVALRPNDPGARGELAGLLVRTGKAEEALALYRQIFASDPDQPHILNNVAWILATHPDPKLRNGPEAVRLAERAVELGQRQHAFLFGTLGAAYAEVGRFDDAIKAAEQAIALAEGKGQTQIAAKNRELLAAYRERKPWREPVSSP
jgi:protein O-mannosyl-transferase